MLYLGYGMERKGSPEEAKILCASRSQSMTVKRPGKGKKKVAKTIKVARSMNWSPGDTVVGSKGMNVH